MDIMAVAHEVRDWLIAVGTVGAVVVALWLATRDRREALAREDREHVRALAQRRIDNSVELLEAWERCWNLSGALNSVAGSGGYGNGLHSKPGMDEARARLTALLRASRKDYPLGWSALQRDSDSPDLLEALQQAPTGPLPPERWVIWREITQAIDQAQQQLDARALPPAASSVVNRSSSSLPVVGDSPSAEQGKN